MSILTFSTFAGTHKIAQINNNNGDWLFLDPSRIYWVSIKLNFFYLYLLLQLTTIVSKPFNLFQ